MKFRKSCLTCTGIFVIFLSGCAFQTDKLTDGDRSTRAVETAERLMKTENEDPIGEVLTLEEALARGLKYNLEARLQLQEQEFAEAAYKVSKFDLLPEFNAAFNIEGRSNEGAVRSEEEATGVRNLEYSRFQEDTTKSLRLDLTFNSLEYGLNYYLAQQNANHVEIMKERRRAVLQRLMSDIRIAYAQAAVADLLEEELMVMTGRVGETLDLTKIAYDEKLGDAMDNLSYQRELIETLASLKDLQHKFAQARIDLYRLINAHPGEDFSLVPPEASFEQAKTVKSTLDQLEVYALLNRPELAEEDYRYENEKLEQKKFWLSLFPTVAPSVAYNYNNNSFLMNNNWISLGANVAHNMMRLLTSEPRDMAIKERLKYAALRRDVLSLAVLGQVNIAYMQHVQALEALSLTDQIFQADKALARETANRLQSGQKTELDLVLADAKAMLSKVELYADIVNVHRSLAKIVQSVGYDTLPFEANNHRIDTLETYIRRHNERVYTNIGNAAPKPLVLDAPNEDDMEITLKAVHFTKIDRPWIFKTGPFATQNEALKAAQGIIKVFASKHSDTKSEASFVPPVPHLRFEGDHLGAYQYYLAFDNLQSLPEDVFCQTLTASGHLCLKSEVDYVAIAEQQKIPDVPNGNH